MSASPVERTVRGELRVAVSVDQLDFVFGYNVKKGEIYRVARFGNGFLSKQEYRMAFGRAEQEFKKFLELEEKNRLQPDFFKNPA